MEQDKWEQIRLSIRARLKDRVSSIGAMAWEMRVSKDALWKYLRPTNPRVPGAFAMYALEAWLCGFRPRAKYMKNAPRKRTESALAASIRNLGAAAQFAPPPAATKPDPNLRVVRPDDVEFLDDDQDFPVDA